MRGWILSKFPLGHSGCEYETKRLVDAAANRRIQVRVITSDQIGVVVGNDEATKILVNGSPVPWPDFILPRMGVDTTYAGFAIIRQLEQLGIPVINSWTSIEACRDKLFSQQLMALHGLPVPKTLYLKQPMDIDVVQRHLGFPLVVKVVGGTEGLGVYMCRNRLHFEEISHLLQATGQHLEFILQEFIVSSHGRDLRVFVVGNEPVACMQRTNVEGGFKANFSLGGQVNAYPITSQVRYLSVETVHAHGLEIAGVDLLFDGPSLKVCEVNSAPGFKGMEHSQRIDIAGAIIGYVIKRVETNQEDFISVA